MVSSNFLGVLLLLLFDITKLHAEVIHLFVKLCHFVLKSIFDRLCFRVLDFSELSHLLHFFVDLCHVICCFFNGFFVCDIRYA